MCLLYLTFCQEIFRQIKNDKSITLKVTLSGACGTHTIPMATPYGPRCLYSIFILTVWRVCIRSMFTLYMAPMAIPSISMVPSVCIPGPYLLCDLNIWGQCFPRTLHPWPPLNFFGFKHLYSSSILCVSCMYRVNVPPVFCTHGHPSSLMVLGVCIQFHTCCMTSAQLSSPSTTRG